MKEVPAPPAAAAPVAKEVGVKPQAAAPALKKVVAKSSAVAAAAKEVAAPPAAPTPVAKEVADKAQASAPAAKEVITPRQAAPTPEASPKAVQAVSEELVKQLQAAINDLTQRLAKAEARICRMEEDGQKTHGSALIDQKPSQSMAVMKRDLQKLSHRVDGMQAGLENTPDYNVRSGFTCESCGSSSMIAVPMRCTSCGHEGWWGWWPKE